MIIQPNSNTGEGSTGGSTPGTGGGGGTIPYTYPCIPNPAVVADPLPYCPEPTGGISTSPFTYTSDSYTLVFNSTPTIDLQKYFNCFNAIPSAGAVYTVKLCADVPVNNDPYKINTLTEPGHVFLTLTKTNGTASVTQSFGFYPYNGPFSLMGMAGPSKVVDNQFHEYHASLSINVTAANFNNVIAMALHNKNLFYDIHDNNCANFGLSCFNSGTTVPLIVSDTYTDTGAFFGKTPVGTYRKLQSMKMHNDPLAANIQIGVFTSPASHGPCN